MWRAIFLQGLSGLRPSEKLAIWPTSKNALVIKVLNDIYPNFSKIGVFDPKTGFLGRCRHFKLSIQGLAHIKVAKSNTPAWIAASRGVLQGAVVVAIIGPAFKLKKVGP